MRSDIEFLIATYEDEQSMLKSLISDSLAANDYEHVYATGKALNIVQAKLHRLKTLKDPLYEEKERIERYTGEFINNENEPCMLYYLQNHTRGNQTKLKKLHWDQGTKIIDTQKIDDALFDLYEGRQTKFLLCVPYRADLLQLNFVMKEKLLLHISVESGSIISANDPSDPEENQSHLFYNLGFRQNQQDGCLFYQYDFANFKDALDIKILLSRIIYDMGYFGEDKIGTITFYD